MTVAKSTISSQYQTTLPKKVRELLNMRANDKIEFKVDPRSNRVFIKKAESIDELADKWTANIHSGKKPLQDADKFYQTRKARI